MPSDNTKQRSATAVTQATRANRQEGVYITICIVLFSVGLFYYDHPFWAVFFLLGIPFAVKKILTGEGHRETTCLTCAKSIIIDEHERAKYLRCPWCFAYSEWDKEGERLLEVEDGRVNHNPMFLLPFAKTFRFPPICCACGRPASGTRATDASYSWKDATTPVLSRRTVKLSVDLPCCELHAQGEQGVAIKLDRRCKFAGGGVGYLVPGFKVASYQFYHAYLLLNGIKDEFTPNISWKGVVSAR